MDFGIDIDGVIRNFTGKLKEVYFREYPNHKIIREDVYSLSKWFPIGKDIYEFAFKNHAEEIYVYAKIYPGANFFLETLYNSGRLTFVSTQPSKELEDLTLEWIEKNKIKFHDLIFTNDKSSFKGDYLLDDSTENLSRVAKIGNSKPVCFDRLWNQDWKGERVKSYNEFLEKFLCQEK